MEWGSLLSLALFTAVCVCALLFISHVLSSQINVEGHVYQLSNRLPQVDPKKAAALIYGYQRDGDDNDNGGDGGHHQTFTLDWLPQKLINDLRRTLIDPRSFLVTSYGTYLCRPDYISGHITT